MPPSPPSKASPEPDLHEEPPASGGAVSVLPPGAGLEIRLYDPKASELDGLHAPGSVRGSVQGPRLDAGAWRESMAVGALVNAHGVVELVILNVGLDLHMISSALFSMMVLMAVTTTFMTPPLVTWIRPGPHE